MSSRKLDQAGQQQEQFMPTPLTTNTLFYGDNAPGELAIVVEAGARGPDARNGISRAGVAHCGGEVGRRRGKTGRRTPQIEDQVEEWRAI